DQVRAVLRARVQVAVEAVGLHLDIGDRLGRELRGERFFHVGLAERAGPGPGYADPHLAAKIGDEYADDGEARRRVLELHVGGALRYGKRDRGDQLPRLERGFVQALEEFIGLDLALAGDDRGAQGEHGRRVVGRRVVVGERAADRPQVPDLPVADDAGERGERGDRLPHGARGGHLGVPHHRADRHGIALRLQRLQVADRVQHRRRRADRARLAASLHAERVVRAGRLARVELEQRHVAGAGNGVVAERTGDQLPGAVVAAAFGERLPDALREPAVHLAFDDHRIDDFAEVVDRGEGDDLRCAGVAVDLDLADIAARGEGEVRRVVERVLVEAGLELVERI